MVRNIKQEIESPDELLKIGDEYSYKGVFADGYQEGKSKINRFYIKKTYIGEKEIIVDSFDLVNMELEDGKIFAIGRFENGVYISY